MTHLRRRASIGYKTKHWNYSLATKDFQVITRGLSDQYSVEPEVSIDGYYRFGSSLILNLNNSHAIFDHSNPNLVTGSRNRMDYDLSWDKRWTWGYLKPKVALKHISYSLKAGDGAELADTSPSVTAPVYSVDAGIFLERDTNWLGNFQQTLEPRLFYVKSDFEDQSDLPDCDTSAYSPSYSTLFLDEIGELPLAAQARLLRFIQEGEIRRIGAIKSTKVDIRLICATHRRLDELAQSNLFRQDLYYRINVLRLDIPPLRQRGHDITAMANWFATQLADKLGVPPRAFSKKSLELIAHHTWPGNVRELQNAVERALIMCDDSLLALDLPVGIGPPEGTIPPESTVPPDRASEKIEQ